MVPPSLPGGCQRSDGTSLAAQSPSTRAGSIPPQPCPGATLSPDRPSSTAPFGRTFGTSGIQLPKRRLVAPKGSEPRVKHGATVGFRWRLDAP